jgi:Transposase DDE domain group 1
MATDCIAQLTFRCQGLRSPIVARFDMSHASSDGGLVLLKAVDERLRLTETVAACLTDPRQHGKVAHSVQDLVRQRVFGLAAGYLDGNDAARLADDPLHKLMLDREPLTGPALGSQPTLSRFENGVSRRDLIHVGRCLARTVIAHHRRRLHGRARRITIDLDPTDDPTHGQQELSFFNGHYDTACYLPLVATVTFDDEPLQYLGLDPVPWTLLPLGEEGVHDAEDPTAVSPATSGAAHRVGPQRADAGGAGPTVRALRPDDPKLAPPGRPG